MDENNMIPDPLREMNWSFDAEGNWQEVLIDGAMQTREHNNQNQIVSIDGVDLEYDPRGNLTRDLEGHTLEWNGRNLLTTYNTNNTYDYDPIGRRVSKTVNGKTTSYVYDGWQVIGEFDSEGVTKRYAYGDYIDEPIVMITVKMDVAAGEILSTDTTYYLEGTNGNVAGVTSNDGELLEYYQYDAYGNKEIYCEKGVDGNWFSSDDVKSESSSVGNSYFFQGRRFDDESGLYYFRYRYYSPELGRFISKDPKGFNAGDVNQYRFVNNSSLKYVDPEGLESVEIIAITDLHGDPRPGEISSINNAVNNLNNRYNSRSNVPYESLDFYVTNFDTHGEMDRYLDGRIPNANGQHVKGGIKVVMFHTQGNAYATQYMISQNGLHYNDILNTDESVYLLFSCYSLNYQRDGVVVPDERHYVPDLDLIQSLNSDWSEEDVQWYANQRAPEHLTIWTDVLEDIVNENMNTLIDMYSSKLLKSEENLANNLSELAKSEAKREKAALEQTEYHMGGGWYNLPLK